MDAPRLIRNYLLALLVFNLAACSTMQKVDVADAMRHPPPPGIDVGSLVEVHTLDGQRLEFRVTDVSDLGLDGKFGLVEWADMARLEAEKPGPGESKVAGYILGALGVIALLALVGSADTVKICSQPPCE